MMQYVVYGLGAAALSAVSTAVVMRLMTKLGIVDKPEDAERKIHKKNIPLGGGLAIFVSFFVCAFIALWFTGDIGQDVVPKHLYALAIGGLLLVASGLKDDIKALKPSQQIWFPVLATLIIIAFGIGPHVVTNPLGGVFRLDQIKIPIDGIGTWVVLADIVVFVWLMGMMYTTKLLDGLDGLVTGIVLIGAAAIFCLVRQPEWWQPEVAVLASILTGACAGFLIWNFHPAKIFLGEGGSLLLGFLLGSLAIISGGKIATTLLVMAVPILDIMRVIVRRIQKGKSPFSGDTEHLHYKMLESGLSQRQAVIIFYTIATLFGATTLFLQSHQKMIALVFLGILMICTGWWFSQKEKKSI